MKKLIATLISLITVIAMFSGTAASAQEKMSYEQMQAIREDYNKNYFGKTYTTNDWIYTPSLREIYSDTEVDEEGDPELIAYEIVYEITKYRNKNTNSVVIPSSINGNKIVYVGDLALRKRPNLKKVTYSNGILSVAFHAFYKNKNIKKVVLPTSISFIGSEAFLNCENLKKVTLPKNVDISMSAFKNCKNIKEFNYKGTSDKYGESYILKEAFANCVKLEKINLGNNSSIGKKAFYNCKSLKSVSIPESTEVILNKAFYNCKNLSKVSFKNTKKAPYIGKNTFDNTTKGIEFVVKNKKVAKSLKNKLKDSGVKNAKILIGKKVVYNNING